MVNNLLMYRDIIVKQSNDSIISIILSMYNSFSYIERLILAIMKLNMLKENIYF